MTIVGKRREGDVAIDRQEALWCDMMNGLTVQDNNSRSF